MTLPSGTITMNQVNVELGNPGTSEISLNDTDVRNLAFGAFTAPTYVGGTSQQDSTSDLTLTGLQSGDLVLFYSAADYTDRNTPSSGWTAIPGLGTQPDNDNIPDSAAFYKFSTGTSVTASNLYYGVHVMIAFRGVDSNNPFNVNAVESTGESGMPNPPSITTTDDNCMIVAVGLLDDDPVASSVTAPSGYTLAVVEDTTSVTKSTVMTAYKSQTSAGSEDPGTFGGSGNDQYKAQTVALNSSTSVPTVTTSSLSGGTSYAPGDGYTYFVFTASETFASTGPTLNTTAEVIAVGGGGGGGGGGYSDSDGGGGGAGGYLRQPVPLSGSFSVPFVIGGGGAGGQNSSDPWQGSNGSNTTLALPSGTITAGYGAGGGGAGAGPLAPNDVFNGRDAPLGSGGGGGIRNYTAEPSSTAGTGGPQGNPGGYFDSATSYATVNAGGGGGAGSAGRNSSPDPGPTRSGGGEGISITSLPYNNLPSAVRKDFAGGGGGSDSGLATAVGGGGNASSTSGSTAEVNSGGGGGGSGGNGYAGGNGAPGIIIMRVSTSDIPPLPEDFSFPTISMSDLQSSSPTSLSLSGGSTWTSDGYTYRAYTSTTSVTVTGSGNVDVLVVGGGGAGGSTLANAVNEGAGGGGAGGFRTATLPVSSPLTITIGGGGNANPDGAYGLSGSNSTFSSLTSNGGGGGGGADSPSNQPHADGRPGASGGGVMGYWSRTSGGTGNSPPVSPPQGNDGGSGPGSYGPAGSSRGGGGGGAGGAGTDTAGSPGLGGEGGVGDTEIALDIPSSYGTPGPSVFRYFAGGGGGGGTPNGASGGYGGGGDGGDGPAGTGNPGTTNTGGGGGGASYGPGSPYDLGGSGGSGIVIVRY